MENEKILFLNMEYQSDGFDEYRDSYQKISDKENNINFSVGDLCECPEDAIIGRSLFDVDGYVNALNKGIELAKKGYMKVEIKDRKKVDW